MTKVTGRPIPGLQNPATRNEPAVADGSALASTVNKAVEHPIQYAKDVIAYDSPRFGTVEMTQQPTQLDQLTGQVVDSLNPNLLSFLSGGQIDGSKAHAKLMPLDDQRFGLVMRRLANKDDGKYLDNYVKGLAGSPAKLDELTGKLASSSDSFGSAMLRERLSPEAWNQLLAARSRLDVGIQQKFDQALGSPAQIQTTLDQRASFAELRADLNRNFRDSSPLVITDREALSAHQHLMGSPHFASDVQRMAKQDEGVFLSRYVEQLDQAAPGKVGEFARKLVDLDPAVNGDTVRNALSQPALSALLRDLDPTEQAALKQRLGGAEAVDRRLDVAGNREALKQAGLQVVGETIEAGATGGEWTAADQKWLADVEAAVVKQDDAAIGRMLETAGPKRFWKLWQEMDGIWQRHPETRLDPADYLKTMQTQDGQAWSVRWNNSTADDVKLNENLAATLGTELGSKVRGRLEYRKEFPLFDADKGVLEGGSTYGFNGWERAEIGGHWTPNSLQLGAYSGRPAVIMNYKERDHFSPELNVGFSDMFVPITKNTILSLGGQGRYGEGKVKQDKNLVFFMQRCDIDSGKLIDE